MACMEHWKYDCARSMANSECAPQDHEWAGSSEGFHVASYNHNEMQMVRHRAHDRVSPSRARDGPS
jgi:hypothetical protein